jgi:hypothetical protein
MPLAAVPAPATHRDDGLLAATLDAIAGVGSLPAQPVVHLVGDREGCRWLIAKSAQPAQSIGRSLLGSKALGCRRIR